MIANKPMKKNQLLIFSQERSIFAQRKEGALNLPAATLQVLL